MSTVNRINRPQMIATVADSLPADAIDDLPMIRQAINDTADAWRKGGYAVREFAQDSIVRAVQAAMKEKRMAISSAYQPKTGARCSCRPGVYRDNCPNCEGTGWIIDFKAIRNR